MSLLMTVSAIEILPLQLHQLQLQMFHLCPGRKWRSVLTPISRLSLAEANPPALMPGHRVERRHRHVFHKNVHLSALFLHGQYQQLQCLRRKWHRRSRALHLRSCWRLSWVTMVWNRNLSVPKTLRFRNRENAAICNRRRKKRCVFFLTQDLGT